MFVKLTDNNKDNCEKNSGPIRVDSPTGSVKNLLACVDEVEEEEEVSEYA